MVLNFFKNGNLSQIFGNIKANDMLYEFIGNEAMKLWENSSEINNLDNAIGEFVTNLNVRFN